MTSQLSYDTELITHIVAAVPVPTTRRLATVIDDGGPLVFSIGNDGKFYLVISNENGVSELQNLGSRLGFGESETVQALAASQAHDGRIVVGFAIKRQDSDAGDGYVLGPILPADLQHDRDLQPSLLKATNQPDNLVFKKFFIGPFEEDMPTIIATYHNSRQDNDIALLVLKPKVSYTWIYDLTLPQNANRHSLEDMCPVNSPFGQGIVYLYKFGGRQSLVFVATEEQDGGHTTVDLDLPSHDIKLLDSFVDKGGLSELILAGSKNLYHLEKIQPGSEPLTLSEDELFNGVDNLFVAQRNDHISILFRNSAYILGYLKGDRTLPGLVDGPPIPLTPKGRGIQFSAIIDEKSSSQRFLLAYEDGSLSLLEKSQTSGIWKQIPFHVASLDKNLDIPSHTCLAQLKNAGVPLAKTKVLLSSSSCVTATVNGHTITVDLDGVEVETDEAGRLNIFLPVSNIASCPFQIKDVQGYDHLDEPLHIDPLHKTRSKLSNISASQLREATTSEGTPLVDPRMSAAELETASDIIHLHGLLSEAKDREEHSINPNECGLVDWSWGAWHWVKEEFEGATNWIITNVGNAWKFIVTIAGKAWEFILDTVERIMNAIEFVFKTIGASFKQLFDWLSFIFNWGDVLQTTDGIVSVVNDMLTFGEKFPTTTAAEAIENFFYNIEKTIEKTQLSRKVCDVQVSVREESQNDEVKKIEAARNSVPANWSKQQQLQYGGVKENIRFISPVEYGTKPSFDDIWNPVAGAWNHFKESSTSIGGTISKAWKDERSGSLGDVVRNVGLELVLSILAAVKCIALAVVGMGTSIIHLLCKMLNTQIEVPVVTPLFKPIAGGRPLTLLYALSLLVAISVTLVAKIVTGKTITDFKYDLLVAWDPVDLVGWVAIASDIISDLIEMYYVVAYDPLDPESPASLSVLSIVGRLIFCAFASEEMLYCLVNYLLIN